MQSKFARDMMAQKLMSENKDNPFNSRFFQPSDALPPPRYTGILLPIERDKYGFKGNFELSPNQIMKDAYSGIMKFGKLGKGELTPQEIYNLAFDTSMNVTGGSLLGSKLIKNAVPKDALAMGLTTKATKQEIPLDSAIKRFQQGSAKTKDYDEFVTTQGEYIQKEMQKAFDFSKNIPDPKNKRNYLDKTLREIENELTNRFSSSKATKATDNSILQQLKTLRSDLKNTTSQPEKVKIEEQITVLRGQREQQLSDLRKEANISRFGYDPNETGNVTNTSYRMQHQPRPDGARLDDMTGGGEYFPDDIYSANGLRIYGNPNNIFDRESFNVIQSVKGKPNAEVTIYRAVPNDKSIETINPGDFVTLSKQYAKDHAAGGYGQSGKEAGKILSKKVKVKEIRSDGNDLNEFGYFPESN